MVTPMRNEPEERGLAAMRAFVTGEGSVSTVFSGLRGIEPEMVGAILRRHRSELTALDPARELILESLVPTRAKRTK